MRAHWPLRFFWSIVHIYLLMIHAPFSACCAVPVVHLYDMMFWMLSKIWPLRHMQLERLDSIDGNDCMSHAEIQLLNRATVGDTWTTRQLEPFCPFSSAVRLADLHFTCASFQPIGVVVAPWLMQAMPFIGQVSMTQSNASQCKG